MCFDSVLVDREGEKVTLGSFLFRDDCYNLLLRLVKISSSISRLHGVIPASPTAAFSSASGISVAGDERPPEDAPPEPSESAPGTAIPRALAVANRPCGKFETMVEAVLPCTTAQVLNGIGGSMLVCHIIGGRFFVVSVSSFSGDGVMRFTPHALSTARRFCNLCALMRMNVAGALVGMGTGYELLGRFPACPRRDRPCDYTLAKDSRVGRGWEGAA